MKTTLTLDTALLFAIGLTFGGLASPATAAPTFVRRAFPLPQPILGVAALDVNGDGRLDVVAAGETKVWAMLAPDWRIVELADTTGGRTIHAVAMDCDGDGDLDLVISRSYSRWIRHRLALAEGKPSVEPEGGDWTVAWLENTGKPEARWPLHVVDRELHGVHGLSTGDVDGNGKIDLLADSFAGPHLENSLAWFPAPFGKSPIRRMITKGGATGRAHYLHFADMNGDGRGDVLLGASEEGTFTWWEQPSGTNGEWQRHLIAREPGATHPRAADLNGDGRFDVLGSCGHGTGVFWYEAPMWRRHVIDANLRNVHAFDGADLDRDGDIDAVGCSNLDKIVRWWENMGGGKFQPHDIDVGNGQQAYDLKIADLDGDGRPDLLLAGSESKNAVVYFQVRPKSK